MSLFRNKSLRRTGNALVCCLAVFCALLGSSAHAAPSLKLIRQGFHDSEWDTTTSPRLSAALKSPDRLWKFLTAPGTPYHERMAAAVQGRPVFPLRWLVRLVTTQETLKDEEALHNWGLKASPVNYGALPLPPPPEPLPPTMRQRHILGYVWTAPEGAAVFEPNKRRPAEMENAPWPMQVQSALELLYDEIMPRATLNSPRSEVARAEEWYSQAFKLPCDTDRQALLFVTVTLEPRGYKSLRLLARWRQIALDPRFPEAGERVAAEIGQAMRSWGDERAQDIGQALLCDILRGNPRLHVQMQAAFSSQYLLEQVTEKGIQELAPPMQVVVAMGDLAANPRSGSDWERLYCFASHVCILLPDAPINSRKNIDPLDPQSPEVHRLLEVFTRWFRERRTAFTQQGAQQIHADEAIAEVRETKF